MGTYYCEKCGQPHLTETARDVHQDECNGGVEDEGDDDDDEPRHPFRVLFLLYLIVPTVVLIGLFVTAVLRR